MTSESQAAFYKATKFWILFLIALVVAAVLWRMWDREDQPATGATSPSAQAAVASPDAMEPLPRAQERPKRAATRLGAERPT